MTTTNDDNTINRDDTPGYAAYDKALRTGVRSLDAGELREYMAQRFAYGSVGSPADELFPLVHRLARMIGQSNDWVHAQLNQDCQDFRDGS